MEMQPVTAQPPDQLRFIFFNDHGLRAGWRLAIFFGLLFPIGFVVLALRSLAPQFPRMSPYRTILGESALFLAVALTSWIMSRIEKRDMGSYGLPLRRNALSDFVVGYIVWGFLALTLLLAAMRALNVFDFGSLALHGNDILKFGMLWGVAFLLVGFFEEYLTRGYLLQTLADGIGFWPAAVGLAVGMHAGWDWAQSYFYGVPDSGTLTTGHLLNSDYHGPEWLSGGSAGPEGSVLVLVLLIAMSVLFAALYRGRKTRVDGPMIVQG